MCTWIKIPDVLIVGIIWINEKCSLSAQRASKFAMAVTRPLQILKSLSNSQNLYFPTEMNEIAFYFTLDAYKEAKKALKNFGFTSFREGQHKATARILSGLHCVLECLYPTKNNQYTLFFYKNSVFWLRVKYS